MVARCGAVAVRTSLIGRYLRPRGEGRVVVLIAAIGMTAVALGLAALIVVMSVMNGARTKLGVQFAGMMDMLASRRGGRGFRTGVSAKLRDIAILRTMGATRASIARIFVAVGSTIGSLGAMAGCALGLAIVAGKDAIARLLQDHSIAGAYGAELAALIDLPAQIGGLEVASILLMATTGTVLVTLYPAFRAASIPPATLLR